MCFSFRKANSKIATVLLGAFSLGAHSDTVTTSLNLQVSQLAVGTCAVNPAASSFALPGSSVGTMPATYISSNFPNNALLATYGAKTSGALNQTFDLTCGSTMTILSMSIAPTTYTTGYPQAGTLLDVSGKGAFRPANNPAAGLNIYAELVSINGTATPFSFMTNPVAGAAVPLYTNAFTVGTTPVPVVWRPAVTNGILAGAALTSPSTASGYTTSFLITINY